MEQKYIKEILEIVANHNGDSVSRFQMADALFEYFEKKYEETTHCYKCDLRLVRGMNCPEHGLVNLPLSKTQIFKWCGVE